MLETNCRASAPGRPRTAKGLGGKGEAGGHIVFFFLVLCNVCHSSLILWCQSAVFDLWRIGCKTGGGRERAGAPFFLCDARASELEAGFSPLLNPVATQAPRPRRQPVCTGGFSPLLKPVASGPVLHWLLCSSTPGAARGGFSPALETRDLQVPWQHQVQAT